VGCLSLLVLTCGTALAVGWSGEVVGVEVSTGDLYDIDPLTGVCTFKSVTSLPTAFGFGCYGASTWDVAHEWHILATSQLQSRLYDVDVRSGTTTLIGAYSGTTTRINGLGYDVTAGVLYGTDYSSLYTIDSTTAVTSKIGDFDILPNVLGPMYAMTYVPGYGLYGVAAGTDWLYKIHTATAALTAIGDTTKDNIVDLAYEPISGKLIGTGNVPSTMIYDIDLGTGVATTLNASGVPNMLGLATPAPTPELPPSALLGLSMLPAAIAYIRGWRRKASLSRRHNG